MIKCAGTLHLFPRNRTLAIAHGTPGSNGRRLVTVWKMARLHDIVFDCRHPASLARFWAEVLDGYRVAPYDEEELRRLAANGIDDPEDDPTVLVEAGAGQPRYFFALVPEGKVVKNRVHLDLAADEPAAEVARLVELGAVAVHEYEGWVQMSDPEGNEFCVLR
jgi:hypothetical protein